ncbi:MAG TPA: hypothetical protein VIO64_22545, partial [Pseudobacteroides sp.]|uniref:hypothetical protein n=1 Tax=Pseudobacteroides sp. TaxID=1968840 RepID=UPI002F92B727
FTAIQSCTSFTSFIPPHVLIIWIGYICILKGSILLVNRGSVLIINQHVVKPPEQKPIEQKPVEQKPVVTNPSNSIGTNGNGTNQTVIPTPAKVEPAPAPPKSTPIRAGGELKDLGNGIKAFALSVSDLAHGISAGVMESITFGESEKIYVYYDSNNKIVYLVGKIIGNTITGVAGGAGTFGSAAGIGGTGGAGALVLSGTLIYCGGLTLSSAFNAAVNIQALIHLATTGNGSGNEGGG